jgi:hypothetical protein
MSLRGFNSCSGNPFIRHLSRFIGETVTIFTTSGGASGCGFTGVILSINCEFVRLVTRQGTAPANPLAENICGEIDNGGPGGKGVLGNQGGLGNLGCKHNHDTFKVGSVCDIPIDRIVAFCHNAV